VLGKFSAGQGRNRPSRPALPHVLPRLRCLQLHLLLERVLSGRTAGMELALTRPHSSAADRALTLIGMFPAATSATFPRKRLVRDFTSRSKRKPSGCSRRPGTSCHACRSGAGERSAVPDRGVPAAASEPPRSRALPVVRSPGIPGDGCLDLRKPPKVETNQRIRLRE
jgi:hypothetical protein